MNNENIILQKLDEIKGELSALNLYLKENVNQVKIRTSNENDISFDFGAGMFTKLAKKCNTDESRLMEIFHIENDDISVLINLKNKKYREQHFEYVILLLTASYYCLGKNSIETNLLKEKFKKMCIKSLQNLSSNLKSYDNYLMTEGEVGSSHFVYKITFKGLQKGIELIDQYLSK